MGIKDDIVSWFKAFISPEKELKGKLGKTTWGEAIKRLIIVGIIYGIIVGFFAWIFSLSLGVIGLVTGLGIWIGMIIMTPIGLLIGWIISAILLFITAKLLGGKASFSQFATDLTWYIAPLTMWLAVLTWIPFIGPWIGALIDLWGLYPLTVVIRDSNKFSTGRAVLTWLIWVIIAIIALIVIGMMVWAAIGAMVGHMAHI